MGDGGEHRGAVADEAVEPLAHAVEGDVGVPRLLRARLGERREALAAAEAVGGAASWRSGRLASATPSGADGRHGERRDEERREEGAPSGGTGGRSAQAFSQPPSGSRTEMVTQEGRSGRDRGGSARGGGGGSGAAPCARISTATSAPGFLSASDSAEASSASSAPSVRAAGCGSIRAR